MGTQQARRLGVRRLPAIFNVHGYATAEFAMTIPLVVMVGVLGIWTMGVATSDVRLQTSAQSAARIVARGQELPRNFKYTLPHNAQVSVLPSQDAVTVTIEVPVQSPIPRLTMPFKLTARAVALREDNLDVR